MSEIHTGVQAVLAAGSSSSVKVITVQSPLLLNISNTAPNLIPCLFVKFNY